MGFLDDAFDDDGFLGRLKETLEDTAWFVGAPAGAAFDMAKAALPGGDPAISGSLQAALTGFQRGTQIFFGDENEEGEEDDEENLFSPATKKALDGLEWVYDEILTPAVALPSVVGQRALADIKGVEDDASPFDLVDAWNETDEGNRSSIGREIAYLWAGIGDGRYLTEEGQQYLDEHSKMFDVMSGSHDFAARLTLDPLILVGKGAKALRLSKSVSAIDDPRKIPDLLSKQTDGLFAGWGKRHDEAMKFAMSEGRSPGELLAAFPGLRESIDGETVAHLLSSSNAALRKTGASEDEILSQGALITRASYGDGTALKEISDKTAFAKDALAAMHSQRDDLKTALEWTTKYAPHATAEDIADAAAHLDVVKEISLRGRDYFASEEFLGLADARLKAVSKDLAAAEREAARQERLRQTFLGSEGKVGVAGTLSSHPLLAGPRAGTKGLEKRAARERGEQVGFDFVFQSTAWNKGVKYAAPHLYLAEKAARAFQTTVQPRTLSVHDDHVAKTLNNFLKHSKLTPEVRQKLVTDMAGARDEHAKRMVVEQAMQLAQRSMIAAYRQKNPHFTDETEKLVNGELAKMAYDSRQRLNAQAQRFSAHRKEDGSLGDIRIDEDGLAAAYPLLETQLVNTFVLPDLRKVEHVLHRYSNTLTDMAAWVKGDRLPDQGRVKDIASRVFDTTVKVRPGLEVRTANRLEAVNNFGWKTEELAKMGLQGFNRVWKMGVLGTRPVAYAARYLTDSGMRAMAVLGPTSFMMHSAPRAFGFATVGSASRARQKFLAYRDGQLDDVLREKIERLKDAWRASNDGPIESPEYDELINAHREVQKRLELYRTGGRQGRREAYGRVGETGHKSIKTRAGEIEGAFASDIGKTQRWKISSETTAAIMGDSEKLALKDAASGQWAYLEHGDPGHIESWLHAVNAQVMQSVVGKKALDLLERTGDREQAARALARWMQKDPEGRQLQRRLQWTAANKEGYSREVVGMVNHLLPTPELRGKALKGRVKQADLEQAFPDPTLRPPVHGESVAAAMGKEGFWSRVDRMFTRYMSWVADAPEDQLARHPMYAAVYEQEAKRRAEYLMADPNIEHLTGGDIKRLIQDQAHKKAQQTIKNYMFDIAAHSDLSHFAQYVSPFIAAWEDTMRKWGRIVREKPDIIGKGYLAWNAPNDMGLVVDENWEPVGEDNINDGHYMIVQWPSWVPGSRAGKAITVGDSNLRIPKQAVNIVLQGGLQPGFGPLVAYPVGKLQVAQPQIEDVARIVNPYGPPDSVWDAVAPSTFKRIGELVDGSSKNHQQDTFRIYRQMLHEHRLDPERNPLPDDPMAEAAKRAKWLGILKIVNNSQNPFPFIFDSPFQLQIDAYRDLQERERTESLPRGWADEQFLKGYGEAFFILVESLSRNNAGVPATVEGVDALKRYGREVSKFGVSADGKPNPTLIRLIVGAEGEGTFSQSAHRWQLSNEITPGSNIQFRDYEEPLAATADADTDLGWLKYRQFMNTVDAMALERGLRTYRDDEELVTTRKEFVENLKAENLPWRVDFEQMDTGKFYRDLENLAEIAKSPKFGERNDMRGVQQYLALRQATLDLMAEGEVSPGSQDALPYKQEFTDAVMDLVSQNTSFAEWSYYQFLERDPLLAPDDVPTSFGASATSGSWGF